MVDPLSYFSFQPVLHDWCTKGSGMCYHVCGVVHIKDPLLLIGNSSPCSGSIGFPLSLSEWFFTICPMHITIHKIFTSFLLLIIIIIIIIIVIIIITTPTTMIIISDGSKQRHGIISICVFVPVLSFNILFFITPLTPIPLSDPLQLI